MDLILIEDKSAGISLIQDLQRAHRPVRAYNPGRADKMQRLNVISSLFARGRVWMPESTQRPRYVKDWVEPLLSQLCAFPDTTHDDFVDSCVDSLTQVCMENGTKLIKHIQVGDMVQTPNGPRRVTAVHDNGMKEVWEIVIGSKRLLATAEHLLFTARGWVRVDCLSQTNDNGYIYLRGDSCRSRKLELLLSRLYSMAESTTVIPKALMRRTANTLRGLATGCIEMFGFTTMGQSPRECTSTTLTATPATMTLPTLLALPLKNIGMSIGKRYPRDLKAQSNWRILKELDPKPLNGIKAPKVESGIRSTLQHLWAKLGVSPRSFMKAPINAFGVALRGLPKFLTERNSAHQNAKQQNQSSALVKRVINTHTMRHVFDLTVEGEHCYYANGILVHNCSQALRFLRDAGWIDIDGPAPELYDEDDYYDSGMSKRKENPYAV